ncbi:MAG: DUF222 domain-containing protein [Nocardioidaceae bacterium]
MSCCRPGGQALQVQAQLDELVGRLVGSVAERDIAVAAGASSSRAWLTAHHRMSAGAASRLVAQANAMTEQTQVTQAAWASGVISAEQAQAIGTAVDSLGGGFDQQAVTLVQVDLIEHAQRLNHAQFRVVCAHAVEVIDPDGADTILGEQLAEQERKALQATQLRFGRCGDGTTAIAGKLPDMHADMLRTRLEALSSPRRASAADPAHTGRFGVAAGGVVGGGGCSQVDVDGDHADTEIGRLTGGQRLGRALCELIEHLPADGAAGHGDTNTTVVVTLDLNQLQSGLGPAVLDTGTPVSAAQARRLACGAGLVPMVLDGPSRILDVGAGRRLFDKHQRLALTVRDQGCVWPGCDRPPAQ